MTERKPSGISFETWVERQIREAQERGAFDDLPGAGKPIQGLDRPFSGERWAADWARREGATTEAMLPEPLRLRKELERLPDTVRDLDSEEAVREVARELNQRIIEWIRRADGPRVVVTPVDPDRLVEQWRTNRKPPGGPTVSARIDTDRPTTDRSITDQAPARRFRRRLLGRRRSKRLRSR